MRNPNPSGLTLDLTKTHILVIDFQWLGVGRVRVGFDIGGVIVYVHEFNHANIQTVPYMATPNLPARAGMTSTTAASTTMRFICASVLSEGGQPDIAGVAMATNVAGTATSGARAHILSLRPKTTFNSLPNRGRIIVDNVSLAVTGSNPVLWELCVGQAISGTTTFADINAYSQVEANSAGTISGSPEIVIASGYATATATARSGISQAIASRYPVTLNAAGAQRALGTLSLIATGIGGSSTVRAGISWREMR